MRSRRSGCEHTRGCASCNACAHVYACLGMRATESRPCPRAWLYAPWRMHTCTCMPFCTSTRTHLAALRPAFTFTFIRMCICARARANAEMVMPNPMCMAAHGKPFGKPSPKLRRTDAAPPGVVGLVARHPKTLFASKAPQAAGTAGERNIEFRRPGIAFVIEARRPTPRGLSIVLMAAASPSSSESAHVLSCSFTGCR